VGIGAGMGIGIDTGIGPFKNRYIDSIGPI